MRTACITATHIYTETTKAEGGREEVCAQQCAPERAAILITGDRSAQVGSKQTSGMKRRSDFRASRGGEEVQPGKKKNPDSWQAQPQGHRKSPPCPPSMGAGKVRVSAGPAERRRPTAGSLPLPTAGKEKVRPIPYHHTIELKIDTAD